MRRTGGTRVDTIGVPPSGANGSDEGGPVEAASSGPYTPGFAHLEVPQLAAGTYTLVATTFSPNERGHFVLKCYSGVPWTRQGLQAVPPEGDGMACATLRGRWEGGGNGDGTAAGCTNYGRYDRNPVFRVVCTARTTLLARLVAHAPRTDGQRANGDSHRASSGQALNLALFAFAAGGPIAGGSAVAVGLPRGASPSMALVGPGQGPSTCRATSHRGVYTAAACGVVLGAVALEAGTYLAVLSTFEPWAGEFSLVVYTHPAGAQVSQVQ